jgi:hypothetical protein
MILLRNGTRLAKILAMLCGSARTMPNEKSLVRLGSLALQVNALQSFCDRYSLRVTIVAGMRHRPVRRVVLFRNGGRFS